MQAEDSRRGKGVSKEAQEIFDALSRTLPAQWDGENIIVLGQVLIAKPYRVEDCKAGKEVQVQMVQRIKKVVSGCSSICSSCIVGIGADLCGLAGE